MMGLNVKWIIAGIATATLALIITLGYKHYAGLVEKNVNLAASNAQLQVALDVEKASSDLKDSVILEWQVAAEEAQLEQERLSAVAQRATAETRRLNGIFAEHDLTRLSLAKPGLVERRINSGTARVGRMLECASGGGCESSGATADTN